jgi:hypothetical protein
MDKKEQPKELTREYLYSVLIEMFKDEQWHCSKSEDGLVEVRFYVSN